MREKCSSQTETLTALILGGLGIRANAAPSMTAAGRIGIPLKRMTTRARGLASVLGRNADSAKKVGSACDEFKVCRVAATPVGAEVIKFRDPTSMTKWQWSDSPCVHQSVDKHPFTSEIGDAIPASGDGGGPVPTPRLGVELNLGEQATDRVERQVWNGEILWLSHARVLPNRVRVWLEPTRCANTAPARLLYHAFRCANG